MKYVIGFDLAVVLVEVGAEVLHQQEVEDFLHMEEVVALQVQMVHTVVLVQAEQLDRVVLVEVDPHLMELVVVEVLHRRVELEEVVHLAVELVM